jgi:L-alanine-DL-glutamate epimerase-like enolase superfamily enzyme
MEAAHTPASIRASARLGVAEMIKGGTTCALTMETVRHTREVFRVVEETPAIEDGQIVVPKKPGLGLAFDQAAIKRYQVG